MSDNWVVQNLENALNTWNEKLAEIWQLITQSPENFKGGTIWNVIVDIHGAVQAIGLALLVLFFVVGVMRTCGNFAEVKRPEQALKLFIRFAIAKGAVTYGLELMMALFKIVQGMISTIMNAAGFGSAQQTVLPQEIVTAVEDCGFFESIPLWAVTLIGGLFITVLSFIMIMSVYGRFFKLYIYTAIAPVPLAVISENIQSETEAEELRKLCDGTEAVVTRVKREQKKTSPPKLYDLTSLQREANRFFGYTAQKTLDMLQELYEEKMVTYPRTDSQYVTEDMKETVKMLAESMTDFLPFLESGQIRGNIDRVVNNAKVSDHHAILPTKEAMEKGMGGLSGGKKNLLMLIGQQLVQATGEEYLYEQTEISVQCKEHEFTAKGKLPVQMGFKEVEEAFRKYCVKDKKSDEPDNKTELPEGYEEGMTLVPVKAEKSTHYTSPPKMFTEDTLLAAMETAGNKEFDSDTEKKGLGTPATRANIIEKLVFSGYAERKGKQIFPTVAGCELIHVMPENLKSASLTAEWENQLLMMEKGKIQDDEFMDGIVSMIIEILSVCREIPEEERNRFQTAREIIGKCPVCGSDVYEGKTNYYCSDRSCPFALWKSNRFLESMKKSMDKKMAVELLKKGRTHVKGLYSKKKDSKFDADLVLGVEDGKARFSLEFPKKKTNSKKK